MRELSKVEEMAKVIEVAEVSIKTVLKEVVKVKMVSSCFRDSN